jgi:hypothetical protein
MIMGRLLKNGVLALLIGMWTTMCAAEGLSAKEISKEQVKELDAQVQNIKNDVLDISAEIAGLEEKFIYPANTRISIFLAVAPEEKFRLDAVKLKLDGKEATGFVYTSKELDALQLGGVQRIYTGNIQNGEHTLEVAVTGKSTSNNDYQQHATYKFAKDEGTKLVEIMLAGPSFGDHGISFKN